jgi:hypothetical protein
MATDYTTYDDLVQHLAMRHGLTLTGISKAQALTAVREAYRRLFAMHDWAYFKRFELLQVSSPQDTGTVVYTHATRTMTLTGATWPSAAAFGDLRINDVRYHILYRKSDTELILPENFNPGADVASTTYAWAQHRYPLSFEVGDITEIIDPQHPNPLYQIDVRSAMFLTDSYNTQTFPTTYSMFPSQNLPGIWEVWFPSAVYADREIKIMYDARHSPLKVQHEDGIGLSVSGQVATFPANVLTEDHVGCVLRISGDDQVPTSRTGRLDDTNQDWNHRPFALERVVVAVVDDTAILSESIGDDNLSDRGWSLSQLLDLDSGSMTTFMIRLVENEYAKIADIDTRSLNLTEHWQQKALVEAQCDDSRRLKPRPGSVPAGYPYRIGDIASTTV